ncbi:MAG TPA: hypothetical protein VGQ80_00020 [Acidimicrobiia bacterium]|jgi:hypothetical protein|nr:hypothetical protein [Acidimicrobiia bacterium]
MSEVDRRGFLRILRRTDAEDEEAEAPEPTAKDLVIKELADLTLRLLADVDAENEERLAEGTLMTVAYDLVYMRVTPEHIVFSIETGFSTIVQTKDVRALDADPPAPASTYGNLVYGVLRAHHPADLEHITRSYGFRFREDSPLLAAIRTACNLPEPEEPEEPTAETPAD